MGAGVTMSNHLGFRAERKITASDPEFSVRLASVEDLVGLLLEAKEAGLSATWSSSDSLLRQVSPRARAIICPLFSNGGRRTDPESFRCHIWFVDKRDERFRVSLIDVTQASFYRLPEVVDPMQLKKVVRVLMDGLPLSALE